MKRCIFSIAFLFLAGCGDYIVDNAISRYQRAAVNIKLGQKQEEVVPLLASTQIDLPVECRKNPEFYFVDGNSIEIFYFRSGRYPDGLTTDDEFSPYIFINRKLVRIGWNWLGGPKSRAQLSPIMTRPTPIYLPSYNTSYNRRFMGNNTGMAFTEGFIDGYNRQRDSYLGYSEPARRVETYPTIQSPSYPVSRPILFIDVPEMMRQQEIDDMIWERQHGAPYPFTAPPEK